MESLVDPPHLSLFTSSKSIRAIEAKERMTAMRDKPKMYKTTFQKGTIPMSLTFNDILLVPQYGEIESR